MANGSTKPIIFISYSHKDEPEYPGEGQVAWLTFVQSFLAPAVKTGIFEIWVDENLNGGDLFDPAIARKLAECDIFVLLASRYSLASSYVVEIEVATIRRRQQLGEDVRFFPIVLTPLPDVARSQVGDIILRPSDGRPLLLMSVPEREAAMAKIADEIAQAAEELHCRRAAVLGRYDVERAQKIEIVPSAESLLPSQRQASVHLSLLPDTPYERLVGREDELRRLDDAWSSPNINIISFVGDGGTGKSALVNEWLRKIQADNYQHAHVVLGWSFHSQGHRESIASAEPFLAWALERLDVKLEANNAIAKGEALAEAVANRSVLLILDGCEPLQSGIGAHSGELKDVGLRTFLRRLAALAPSEFPRLVVLTSRLPVGDIARWRSTSCPLEKIDGLSVEAGKSLLRDNSVWGTDEHLRLAVQDFAGHPLALGLLAGFVRETQFGDIRRRDHIRSLISDADNAYHDQARRVLESYAREWLSDKPIFLTIMRLVGLFDRPASEDCLEELRAKPAIKGLTDEIVKLRDDEWRRAIERLRQVRLLAPQQASRPGSLDAHPLVREWFGEDVRRESGLYRAAHSRLFDHLRRTTREGDSPTLEKLEPLYQAVVHGCKAGRYKDALKEIYEKRICRNLGGMAIFYASAKLCAFTSNLAAISWFFDQPYTTVTPHLHVGDQAWLLNEAGHCLGAQGRFLESLAPLRAALAVYDENKIQPNLTIAATNLSETEMMVGQLDQALVTSALTVMADKTVALTYRIGPRGIRGAVLHAKGDFAGAQRVFKQAEDLQRAFQPAYPLLYSLQGFYFCDLLLTGGGYDAVIERIQSTLKWSTANGFPRDIALDELNLVRAKCGAMLNSIRNGKSKGWDDSLQEIRSLLGVAVHKLRNVGEVRYAVAAFILRGVFRRNLGDWSGAQSDLDEAEEIAELGDMKLSLCDIALEKARLLLSRAADFAPLDFDGGSSKLNSDPKEADHLTKQASGHLTLAAERIHACGYFRRKDELEELQAVVLGNIEISKLEPRA